MTSKAAAEPLGEFSERREEIMILTGSYNESYKGALRGPLKGSIGFRVKVLGYCPDEGCLVLSREWGNGSLQ